MTTIEQCEERIKRDPKLLQEALNDNDFAGFLAGSFSPMENDTLEFGERVKDFINVSITAAADFMMREENAEQEESKADRQTDDRLLHMDFAAEVKRLNGRW